MCRAKLREKDKQLHELQLQLHQLSIEKDALASEYVLLKNEMAILAKQHAEQRAENARLQQHAHRDALHSSAASSSSPAELVALKSSYESQLDSALLRQQSSYEAILGQMKAYLTEQEREVAAMQARVNTAAQERDEARAALARAEGADKVRAEEADRRVDDAVKAKEAVQAQAAVAVAAAEASAKAARGSWCRTTFFTLFWSLLLAAAVCLTVGATIDSNGFGPILCAKFMGTQASGSAPLSGLDAAAAKVATPCTP